ncbi:MAG: DUF2442 domain-containing protein [Verrucomicrobia bacterium]|nr:DUF2442 domain-containing protein [Verrucomicrobiota bacterium]
MKTTAKYPKIRNVSPKPGKTLLVTFDNGDSRLYDCKPLLDKEVFRPLREEAIFRCAHADSHGHGVVWNDDIDLAESEIWLNGKFTEPDDALDKQ